MIYDFRIDSSEKEINFDALHPFLAFEVDLTNFIHLPFAYIVFKYIIYNHIC